jgi:hypothetical protein
MPATSRLNKGDLPNFRLTRRDREIIKAVYTHRALTAAQIETLLFPPDNGQRHRTKTSRCRHRLKLLYHHGFLFRDEQPTKMSEGRKPLVYFVDSQAVPLLADIFGLFPEDIDWQPRDNKVSWMYMEHLLATNDFRISVEAGARARGFELGRWLDDRTLKSREMKDSVEIANPRGGTIQVTIVPDGYFSLSDGEYHYDNLLEVDMGTETVRSSKFGRRDFSRKIKGYLAYHRSGRYEARYGSEAMRVLVVTTSPKRLASLRAVTEKEEGGIQFWFTTFDKVTPESVLTEPIWQVAGQDGLRPLVW